MVGYFTSGSLSELARSFAYYLRADSEAKLKIIISPNLPVEDIEALMQAVEYDENLLPLLFPEFDITEESLRTKSVAALAYLIASNRIEIKVAVMTAGLFHTKCYLFDTEFGVVAIHGSSNATRGGLANNFEQLGVSRSWKDDDAKFTCDALENKFTVIWNKKYSTIKCYELNKATLAALISVHEERKGTEPLSPESLSKKLIESIENDERSGHSLDAGPTKLTVPDWINYSSGPYSHQGEAVQSWINNKAHGIFSIATGGGKTLTSLIGAALLNNDVETLFVVVAVPTTALVAQWAEDVRHFGVTPINTSKVSKSVIHREIKSAFRNLRLGISKSEVIIVTHDNLRTNFKDILIPFEGSTSMLLIGDEVHNLGSSGFRNNAPTSFTHKLGLSATHERQFDEEGSEFLLDYFGDVVFDFPLDEAIGKCLVPYNYFVHQVMLTVEEEEEFTDLTYEIKKLSYASHNKDGDITKERWQMLCIKRRRLIECAENKIKVFEEIFPEKSEDVCNTMIFCTDKSPQQLDQINSIMNQRSIHFHQVTGAETGNPKLLASIVGNFKSGGLQVLTSKRVLDEGFNAPQTETAYLVSSNTVRRQWIQRLGRVLRMSEATGKTNAVIHDFMVIPAIADDTFDDDLRTLLDSEYSRLNFFCSLSANGSEPDGALFKIDRLLELLRK
jgi:superfamily II DNA or RNA helicase